MCKHSGHKFVGELDALMGYTFLQQPKMAEILFQCLCDSIFLKREKLRRNIY